MSWSNPEWFLVVIFALMCGILATLRGVIKNQETFQREAKTTNLYLRYIAKYAIESGEPDEREGSRRARTLNIEEQIIRGVSDEEDLEAEMKEQAEERRREREGG